MIPGALVSSSANTETRSTGTLQVSSDDRQQRSPGQARNRLSFLWEFVLPNPETGNCVHLFLFILTDAAAMAAAGLLPSLMSVSWSLPEETLMIYVSLVTLLGFSEGLYREDKHRSLSAVMAIASKSALFSSLIIYVGTEEPAPRIGFIANLALSLVGLATWRRAWVFLQDHAANGSVARNVLIVGAGPSGREIARCLRDDKSLPVIVRGFLDDSQGLSPDVLGRVDDLPWLARAEFIDEIIIALPNQAARTRDVVALAQRNHLDVRVILDLPAETRPSPRLERIGGIPVVTVSREHLPDAALSLKRCLDIAGATVGLILSVPVMAVIALLIRCETAGNAIYAADRAGLKGRRFRCFKFRTMVKDADQYRQSLWAQNQRQGPNFKLEHDPRITRVGNFLRRYSLDELPQLWNVLRGEMSLVGPRPHPLDEVGRYDLHHFRRLDVKPGLTGLWQITARRDPSFARNMRLDLTYIQRWNLMLDLKILLRTIRVLFVPDGV
jgi:exopolysaccharide biosynthesis polyprenyl glycosylphosphotransferase